MARNTSAVRRTNEDPIPFLRLSNRHNTASMRRAQDTEHMSSFGFSSLADLGLYAMLGAFLSNPAFTYAHGGLTHLLSLHAKNRYYSLHGALMRLQKDGYLQRTRIPCGKNCFHDYYTLYQEKQEAPAAPVCLSACAGQAFVDMHKPFAPPVEDFTSVSIPMLMDPSLSLAAKGLYIVLARYLRLMQYRAELSITKDLLKKCCREGSNAFDRMFRELRDAGYLFLTRARNEKTGYPCYHYTLYKTASTASAAEAVSDPAVTAQNADSKDSQTNHQPMQSSAAEKAQLRNMHTSKSGESAREAICTQIEYNCLAQTYPTDRLDCIVSILNTFRRSSPRHKLPPSVLIGGTSYSGEEVAARLAELDSEDVRFVLDTYEEMQRSRKIHNIRGYLLSCLFRAKETLAMALDSFAIRTPGAILT